MILNKKTLEKLRILINEEIEYRSGSKLVAFFNNLGFKDEYGQGFPARWIFTDERLSRINGKPELDICIKRLFAPINFIGKIEQLDDFIKDFNQYLAFDKWKIVRKNEEITFIKTDKVVIDESHPNGTEEEKFLAKEFKDIPLSKLCLETSVSIVIEQRLDEIKICLQNKAPLSVIFLSGSTLEGILLGMASMKPEEFNTSKASPKNKEGKIKKFHEWTLNNFIDVAFDIGLLKEDVKKFSHTLREFRNYIHPYQQVSSNFNPDIHTAKVSWHVLKAAIFQLSENI
jgi:hypothetical protein